MPPLTQKGHSRGLARISQPPFTSPGSHPPFQPPLPGRQQAHLQEPQAPRRQHRISLSHLSAPKAALRMPIRERRHFHVSPDLRQQRNLRPQHRRVPHLDSVLLPRAAPWGSQPHRQQAASGANRTPHRLPPVQPRHSARICT